MTALLVSAIRLFPTWKPARVASVVLRPIRPDDAVALTMTGDWSSVLLASDANEIV